MSKRSRITVRRLWGGILVCCVLGGVAATQSSAQLPKGDEQLTDQGILFDPVAPQSATDRVPLQAAADSGLPIVYRSKTPSICTVRKSLVTLHSGGVCLIEASQPGNEVYAAAPPVTQRFTVRAAKHCCGLFDIAQIGTIVRDTSIAPAVAETKRAFCPMPALDSEAPLAPDTWIPGSTFKLEIRGSGFTTAADATKTCPATIATAAMNDTSIPLTNQTVVSSTMITATVSIPADLPAGVATVYLWAPDPSKK